MTTSIPEDEGWVSAQDLVEASVISANEIGPPVRNRPVPALRPHRANWLACSETVAQKLEDVTSGNVEVIERVLKRQLQQGLDDLNEGDGE